jgi:Holliday junction DNA helicase RuvA
VIGSLAGLIAAKETPRLLVDVHGVGYEVEVPMSTWLALPPVGQNVRLLIHHVVREDASLLFGFGADEERALFRALLKVNGVGPRMALAILSGVSAQAFRAAIAGEDAAALTRIPGVGRKTAERLLVEMREHFRDERAQGSPGSAASPRDEALHALLSLGYKQQEAQRMLDKVARDGATTEDLIRAALQGTMPTQGAR